jgi:hypothetical protein
MLLAPSSDQEARGLTSQAFRKSADLTFISKRDPGASGQDLSTYAFIDTPP